MAMPREPNRSRPRSFLGAVRLVPPFYVLIAGLLPGFALIFLSMALGNATWTASSACDFATVDREVGYLAALNWSLTFAILFPLLMYLMTNTISGLAHALDRLHARGMIRKTENMELVRDTVLTSSWLAGSRGRTWLLIIFAALIPLGIGLTEWFLNNFLRLVHISRVPLHSDYDWGLAGIMPLCGQPEWSFTARLANALFDLLAFATEALLIGSLMAFFIAALDLSRVMPSDKPGALVLVPHLESRDRRLGFEEFAYPLEQLLGVALLAYLVCYMVRLEGVYMASTTSSSLADFVHNDILSGIRLAAKVPSRSDFADAFVNLLDLRGQTIRGALAEMASVLVAIFSLATVMITVRGAALSAKNNALQALEDGSLGLNDEQKAAASKKIDAMVVWPLGYLKLDTLILWVLIAVLTLFLYRIGLFIAGIVAFSLFFRLVKKLIRPGKSNGPAPETRADGG